MITTEGKALGITDLVTSLPAPEDLLRKAQPLAMLDAILGEFAIFSVDLAWGEDERVAQLDDGGGNSWSLTMNSMGAWLRGFDHESPMSPWDQERPHENWIEQVPEPLRAAVLEPAFAFQDMVQATFGLWWLNDEPGWHVVRLREASAADADEDGSSWLLDDLLGGAGALVIHADEFEVELSVEDAEHLLAMRPLTEDLVRRVNPKSSVELLREQAQGIGYPLA